MNASRTQTGNLAMSVVMCVASRLSALALLSTFMTAQTLSVAPREALADEPLIIRAQALRPGIPAVIRARTTDAAGNLWQSYAGAFADGSGQIDLSSQPAQNGSYTGINPYGLIHSMNVAGAAHGRERYNFDWKTGMVVQFELEVDGKTVATMDAARYAKAPAVIFEEVQEDGLRGMLFYVACRKAPGILVLGGSEGGNSAADVAALLASHGFTALALAYFGSEGLPSALDNLPLEYFDRAISFLRIHGSVVPDKIGILATSKGSEAALLIASRNPSIHAVVAYAPSAFVWSCICNQSQHSSWSLAGKGVPFVPAGNDPTYAPPANFPVKPVINYNYRLRNMSAHSAAAIPVGDIAAPVMLISGSDDQLWPSDKMARLIAEQRARAGKHRDVYLYYAKAGHLIGKYIAPSGSTRVAGGRIETGGEPEGNAAAQRDSWPKVLAFLQKELHSQGR